MHKAAGYALAVALVSIVLATSARANAGTVSGMFSDPNGKPLAGHQLHFENRISGDIYLARTGSDGSFSAALPPGAYDLRAERGLILYRNVLVDSGAVNLGQVHEGAPLDVRRPFEREGIAPSMVETQAPATAHLHSANHDGSPARGVSASGAQSSAAAPSPAPSAPPSAAAASSPK